VSALEFFTQCHHCVDLFHCTQFRHREDESVGHAPSTVQHQLECPDGATAFMGRKPFGANTQPARPRRIRCKSREDPAGPVDHVLTWNADSNTHMVAVNEALGFEPVEWCGMLQKRL